jgi:hypothetical protein
MVLTRVASLMLSVMLIFCDGALSHPEPEHGRRVLASGGALSIGPVVIRGVEADPLHPLAHDKGFTNGIDSFYITRLTDGGTFVLHRYAPSQPTIQSNPYPEITLPGTNIEYVKPILQSPFYQAQSVRPPVAFPRPFSQFKWPGVVSDAGVGILLVAESPQFEEPIEPFVSAYPTLRVEPDSPSTLQLRFGENAGGPSTVALDWKAVERTEMSTTYVSQVFDPSARAIAIHVQEPSTLGRVWYRNGETWNQAQTESGGPQDPTLLILHAENPNAILVESQSGPPENEATIFSASVGYVRRARWTAFTVYDYQTSAEFFDRSMIPSMKAYNDQVFSLRDHEEVLKFPDTWRTLLQRVGFTDGHNLLNPEFFDRGFPAYGDPAFQADERLRASVSWVGDEAALQAMMGARLFGFDVDARYDEAVMAFYDPTSRFYFGSLQRDSGEFTSADTGSTDRVIGYNYLLSLMRLTELLDSRIGLSEAEVQRLVDGVLPVLQGGYVDDYPQVAYLWGYPDIRAILQSEYGMGRELSEAQLSYVCGLWWLRTHEPRYRRCQIQSLRLPETFPLTLRGSSHLWGLDVVHGAYVTDALLLAHRTTGARHYLDAALDGWREELLFLFSNLNYPETSFDDRAMAVTSYYSTFADLHRGNYWRGDAWNNSRTLWSLSKLLAFVDDARIRWQLEMARETHKQSMPVADQVYNPIQRSDFYDRTIDRNNFELNYEGLAQHYSTQIGYSNDLWREAFIFDSIRSSDATVYRIPGAIASDPGLAFVRGSPNQRVRLTIDALDCSFKGDRVTRVIRLNSSGVARVELRSSVPSVGTD